MALLISFAIWIKKEFLHVLPVFLFFLFFFTSINLIEAFSFKRMGVVPFPFIQVALAAGLIAKIILVVDHLPLINRFKKKPLIYVVFWKTTIYWTILLFVRIVIRYFPFLMNGVNDLQDDFYKFLDGVDWRLFISVQLYYLMLLFVFLSFKELTIKIGFNRMRQIFFGKQ